MAKSIDTVKKLCQLMGKTTSLHQNGRIKFTHNNIKLKCKWAKSYNQKKQTAKFDKKSEPFGVLYPEKPSHMQGYTQAQNKEMEEDLPRKWRATTTTTTTKTGVVILVSDKIDFKPTKIKRD